jgi:uncharacterized protein (UPF0218 family)
MEVEIRLKSNQKEENNIIISIQGENEDVAEASSVLCAHFKLLIMNTRPQHGVKSEVEE